MLRRRRLAKLIASRYFKNPEGDVWGPGDTHPFASLNCCVDRGTGEAMTRNSVDRDDQGARHCAPPWVRSLSQPVNGQPTARGAPTVNAGTQVESSLRPRPRPQYRNEIAVNELGPSPVAPGVMPELLLPMRQEPPRRVRHLTLLFIVAGIAACGLTIVTSRPWPVSPVDTPATGRVALVAADGKQPMPATAPRLIVQDRRAYVNEPLLIGLSLGDASGGEILLLKGLEAATRLSHGKPADQNSWRVSAFDLGNLWAYAPKDYVGTMEGVVDLHSADDRRLASQNIRLQWIELTPTGRTDPPVAPEPPPAVEAPATTLKLQPDEFAMLLQRGQDMLKLGDIPSARIVLRRAAEAGNSEAALMLASTFDPIMLRQLGVIGLAPDIAQALSWYEKAFSLGSSEAKSRIERLGHAASR
jgi:hypothetical protein